MIKIDTNNYIYTCPFCDHDQAYYNSFDIVQNGRYKNSSPLPEAFQESSFVIYTITCRNKLCGKTSVTAINRTTYKQIDIVPEATMKHYPEYIPLQIRNDYEEACLILERSPKAAATLLRRCLQGMIHDFWNIYEKNLNAEITSLKTKISPVQWNAIDSLRKLGNIGAHMEANVNTIIDIEPAEASKLLKLIELLLDKWYVARHDEEQLLSEITTISESKETKKESI